MIRDITIKPALNGFTVRVGCQTLVFNSEQALTSELGRYLRDPAHVEKEYRDTALNAKHTLNDCCVVECDQPKATEPTVRIHGDLGCAGINVTPPERTRE